MPARRRWAEARAAEVLQTSGVAGPPVPVEALARHYGLLVRFQPLHSDLSGFLYRGEGPAVIGVNSAHAPVRQRFTVAHELGHFLLHRSHNLRVDRAVLARWRGGDPDAAPDPDEVEANRFAAALLLPGEPLERELERLRSVDVFHDERELRVLARRFQVSLQTLLLRLTDLGYVER